MIITLIEFMSTKTECIYTSLGIEQLMQFYKELRDFCVQAPRGDNQMSVSKLWKQCFRRYMHFTMFTIGQSHMFLIYMMFPCWWRAFILRLICTTNLIGFASLFLSSSKCNVLSHYKYIGNCIYQPILNSTEWPVFYCACVIQSL